ncbi:MAG: acyl-CoA dehydratase activase [Thermodesulfobacteriota bacterium]
MNGYFCGIDIGSTAIKVAIIDQAGRPAASTIARTGGHFVRNARAALEHTLAAGGIEAGQLRYTVATGYGRKLFPEADERLSEITANALGATADDGAGLGVRTVINIGGQDSKVIALDDQGQVRDFAMNDKCAAGTGRFLEMAARSLEVPLEDLGRLHTESAEVPVTISSTCTVFAESELVSLLAAGRSPAAIARGIHYAIARRIARLARRLGVEDPVLFDGGPALNPGLVAALEDELLRPVIVAQTPQITTALGAALAARNACQENEACPALDTPPPLDHKMGLPEAGQAARLPWGWLQW